MIDLFYEGGTLFMTLISLAGLTALGICVPVAKSIIQKEPITGRYLKSIPIAGGTAFMLGILAQAIGLYEALIAIQEAGDVSPALIFGGFKVSMICPMYGLLIFVITLIIYLSINLGYAARLEK